MNNNKKQINPGNQKTPEPQVSHTPQEPQEQKKIWPIVIAVLVLATIVIVLAVAISGRQDGKGKEDTAAAVLENQSGADSSLTEKEDDTAAVTENGSEDGAGEEDAGNAAGDENTNGSGSSGGADNDSSGSQNSGSSGSSSGSGSSGNSGSSSSGNSISFPYTSSLDELKLEAIYNYSGYYIEDGSEDAIDSVAALEVTNISSQILEYADITLTADGQTLHFEVSLLPAGATVLVMEADRKSCGESAVFTYGGSEIASLSSLDLCEDQVTVTTNDSGSITVTNISDQDISELRLFYKNQLETGEYVGGIAYTVKLEDLKAGASQTVTPSHFDPDCGVVMMVRIY